MINVLYFAIAILIIVEFYSIGVFFAARKCGEPSPWKCFIPFVAFNYVRRMTGPFSVLVIPVKRYTIMMVELAVISVLAFLYACWGDYNLPEISAESLWQIMILVIVVMAFIAWVSVISSSWKMYRRFNVRHEGLFVWLSLCVVTIPVFYTVLSIRKQPRTLEQMY